MNELEQEYQDNLQRVKRRENRRRVAFLGLYFVFVFVMFVAYLARGELSVREVACALPLTIILAGVSTFRVARYLLKRFEDRNVEVSTTERERAYREAIIMMPEADARPAKPRLLALFALIPVGLATFGFGVLTYDPHYYRSDRPIALGITITIAGVILVGKHIYATWRARRNARLELQWEKWLDSADSCEVGPRKWTK
jgi:hypothetical protein